MALWLWRQIFKFRQCIFAISLFTPLGKSCWPSFEQTWITFVQSLVKTGSVVLEKKILKHCQYLFCYFVITLRSPLEKDLALHLYKLESPLPKNTSIKFDWNWPSGSEEEDEDVKSLRQWWHQQRQPRTTDKFRSEQLTWAFCSGELKTCKWTSLWTNIPNTLISLIQHINWKTFTIH